MIYLKIQKCEIIDYLVGICQYIILSGERQNISL